jgi:DnaJ like chaperone protein
MIFWIGLVGFFFFGFKGMILGMILGAFFGGTSHVQKVRHIRSAYFEALFSMLAKLAKADGVIDSKEAEIVTQFIRQSGLPDEMKVEARKIFNSAKDDSRTFEDFAREFKRLSPGQVSLHNTILVMLCQIAAADGVLAPSEEKCLRNAAEIFGFNANELKAILSNFFTTSVTEYYQVLGCTEQSTDHEIKRSYKKLVKQYHPDKLVAKGLPKEFVQQATQRFRQVQEAYDHICKLRGIK